MPAVSRIGDVASIPVVVDVMAIPTLMVLRRGQVVAQRAGAAPAVSLRTWVEEVFGN
jgi:thioredoxin-like negative regulator of GroEL